MIKRKTVFVLGAGASVTFGYPTGIQLKKLICNILKDPASVDNHEKWKDRFKRFEEIGFYKKDILKFREEFLVSTLYSIDTFLEHRPEFKEIGKVAIAEALIPQESERLLFETDNNWYAYLFNRLNSEFEKFGGNIAFVTFNYDRSLEHYLYRVLMNAYGKNSTEVVNILRKIPIVHLYGQLDYLPWQDSNGQSYDDSRNQGTYNLKKSANMIQIISENEDISTNENFLKAYNLLENFQKICFLGFGYDLTNLERLRINDFCRTRSPEGTAYKLEPSKRREVGRYANNIIDLREPDVNVLEFLKKYGDFV